MNRKKKSELEMEEENTEDFFFYLHNPATDFNLK